MRDWEDDLEALRRQGEEPPRLRKPRNWILVTAASLGAAVIAVASSGGVFFDRGPADDESPVTRPPTTTATVLGVTVTRPSVTTTTAPSPPPAVIPTTADAFAAALAAATPPAGSTSSSTTTSTAPPAPAPIAPVSASSAAPGVTLRLDAAPAGASRSVDLRLAVRLDGLRILRTARVAFGDGNLVDGAVQPYACGAADAPNPYVLTVSAHTYRAAGTYTVTVSAATAACSLEDDDLGPDEPAEVRLTIVVP